MLDEPQDGRSEAGRGVTAWVTASGAAGMTTRIHPDGTGLAVGLNQRQELGSEPWLGWEKLGSVAGSFPGCPAADVALSHHILPGKVLGPHTSIGAARQGSGMGLRGSWWVPCGSQLIPRDKSLKFGGHNPPLCVQAGAGRG